MAERTSAMDWDRVSARWVGEGRELGSGDLLLRLCERGRQRERCLRRPPGPTGGTAGRGGRAFFSGRGKGPAPPSVVSFAPCKETMTDLRFTYDIDGLAAEEEELEKLVERLDKASTAFGMEISANKTKLMTNNTSGIN